MRRKRIPRSGRPARWRRDERIYLKEMRAPGARHLIELLATMSASADLDGGCSCEDARRCHRSLLGRLLAEAGATMAAGSGA